MKIALITLEYPPQKGGVAAYYGGLVEELRRQGHEVEVVTNSPTPPSPPSGRGGNNRLLSKWIWPKWLRAYSIVRRAVKKKKYDLLFVGQILPFGTVAYLLRRRVPYVVFTHGMDVLMAKKSWRKRCLTRRILQQAKVIVANSEFTRTQLRLYPNLDGRPNLDTNAVVVYPCPTISTAVIQDKVEMLRRKLGLTGKKILLTLGRVVERKGYDLVIKALPEILQHVPEAVYVVAGDGPDLGRLQRMTGNPSLRDGAPSLSDGTALQSSVRFVGAVSDEDRPLYYALCDLFVMPSRQIGADVEGFGLSFLEAAMFGKLSVGGRSGGIPEAILDGKTGALVDPNDASALARVVVQLLRDDGLRRELGQNAKARALHEFRWERQIEKLRM